MMIRNLLFSFLCFLPGAAFATDYLVTSTDDSGPDTLRTALESIEEGDTITFDDISGTIQLASALPEITISTTITGPVSGAVTIDGSSSYQIFSVTGYAAISNLTLSNNDTSTAGSAILVGSDTTLVLDTVSIPHCGGSCEAPINVLGNGVLVTNNMTFSSPGGAGVDVLFQDGAAGIFACDSLVQPEVWVGSVGPAVIYKEGNGVMQFKASSSVDINFVADEGTLRFSDTCVEPILALTNGVFQGTATAYYVANMGIVETGESFGTITNTTDYYQTSQGALVVKINASGSHDLVQTPGVGYLGGDLIIQLQPGTYTASSTYTLLACDSGFSLAFDNVYFDIPGEGLQSLSNASLNYTSDSVVLEITSTFTVNSAENSLLSKHHHHKRKRWESPVSKLFTWMMEHKKKPKMNLSHTLRDYPKHVEKEIFKEFHKKHHQVN